MQLGVITSCSSLVDVSVSGFIPVQLVSDEDVESTGANPGEISEEDVLVTITMVRLG